MELHIEEINGVKYWVDDCDEWHKVPDEDLRAKWREGLTGEEQAKAESALDVIFEAGAIAGPLYGDEVIMLNDAKQDWKKLVPNIDPHELIENYAYFGYPKDGGW